jgi:hypothetical protein
LTLARFGCYIWFVMKEVKIRSSFNLLKPTRKPLSGAEKIYNWAISFGKYLIIGTEIIVLASFGTRFKLDYDISELTDSIETASRLIKTSETGEKYYRSVISKTIAYADSKGKATALNEEISHLNSIVDSEIAITTWTYDNSALTLTGNSQTLASFSAFEETLQKQTQTYHIQHPDETVPIRYSSITVNRAQAGASVEGYPFTIQIQIEEVTN